jgi:hypothetical protein
VSPRLQQIVLWATCPAFPFWIVGRVLKQTEFNHCIPLLTYRFWISAFGKTAK